MVKKCHKNATQAPGNLDCKAKQQTEWNVKKCVLNKCQIKNAQKLERIITTQLLVEISQIFSSSYFNVGAFERIYNCFATQPQATANWKTKKAAPAFTKNEGGVNPTYLTHSPDALDAIQCSHSDRIWKHNLPVFSMVSVGHNPSGDDLKKALALTFPLSSPP